MQPGTVLHIDDRRYRFEEQLSHGSFGQVWAARDAHNQAVAIKVINAAAMAGYDPSLWQQWQRHFKREVDFLSKLDEFQSQHIIRLLDHSEMEDSPALVMERLQCNLEDWLQMPGNLLVDLPRILDWALQILAGLEVIHEGEFIYRDLKYSNILVATDGQLLKLADFGTVKLQQHDSTLSYAGTPIFMAPEQALPAKCLDDSYQYEIDYRADYYALGLILFGLLTGQRIIASQEQIQSLISTTGKQGAHAHYGKVGGLNQAETDKLRQAIHNLAQRAYGSVGDITITPGWRGVTPAEQISQGVFELVQRLLARDRNDRPAKATEIQAVLQKALSFENKTSPRDEKNIKIVAPSPPPNLPLRNAQIGKKRVWKRLAWPVSAAIIAIALTAFWLRPADDLPQQRHTEPITTAAPLTEVVGIERPATDTPITPAPDLHPPGRPVSSKDTPAVNDDTVASEAEVASLEPDDSAPSQSPPATAESPSPQPEGASVAGPSADEMSAKPASPPGSRVDSSLSKPVATDAPAAESAKPASLVAKREASDPTPALAPTEATLNHLQDALGNGQPGPPLVILPAGELKLPAEDGQAVRRLPIQSFALTPQLISYGDYALFARETQRSLPYDGGLSPEARDLHPVAYISWNEAHAYAQWLSKKTGQRYRLPSAAEWLYADQLGNTERQGSFQEWLADCAPLPSLRVPLSQAPLEAANGGDCNRRLIQGQGNVTGTFLANNRQSLARDRGGKQVGFRMVREVAASDQLSH